MKPFGMYIGKGLTRNQIWHVIGIGRSWMYEELREGPVRLQLQKRLCLQTIHSCTPSMVNKSTQTNQHVVVALMKNT